MGNKNDNVVNPAPKLMTGVFEKPTTATGIGGAAPHPQGGMMPMTLDYTTTPMPQIPSSGTPMVPDLPANVEPE